MSGSDFPVSTLVIPYSSTQGNGRVNGSKPPFFVPPGTKSDLF